MSMVFDEVLDHVLSKRSSGDDELAVDDDDAAADSMDVDELLPDPETSTREWQARELPASEVTDLTDFFKALSTGSSPSDAAPPPASRLVGKTLNGSAAATVTPVKATRAAALRSNGSTPIIDGSSTFEAETPQGSGKKRKSKAQ